MSGPIFAMEPIPASQQDLSDSAAGIGEELPDSEEDAPTGSDWVRVADANAEEDAPEEIPNENTVARPNNPAPKNPVVLFNPESLFARNPKSPEHAAAKLEEQRLHNEILKNAVLTPEQTKLQEENTTLSLKLKQERLLSAEAKLKMEEKLTAKNNEIVMKANKAAARKTFAEAQLIERKAGSSPFGTKVQLAVEDMVIGAGVAFAKETGEIAAQLAIPRLINYFAEDAATKSINALERRRIQIKETLAKINNDKIDTKARLQNIMPGTISKSEQDMETLKVLAQSPDKNHHIALINALRTGNIPQIASNNDSNAFSENKENSRTLSTEEIQQLNDVLEFCNSQEKILMLEHCEVTKALIKKQMTVALQKPEESTDKNKYIIGGVAAGVTGTAAVVALIHLVSSK